MDPQNAKKPPSSEVLNVAFDLWSQSDGQHYLPIVGTSMLPLICEGDFVLVAHGEAHIERGDIVVFRKGGELITHRVIDITLKDGADPVYHTRGDNSAFPDPPLKPVDILGRVIALKRGDRLWSLDNPAWRWVNRRVAGMMRVANGSGLGSGDPPGPPGRYFAALRNRIVRRLLSLVYAVSLKTALILFGRWVDRAQPERDA